MDMNQDTESTRAKLRLVSSEDFETGGADCKSLDPAGITQIIEKRRLAIKQTKVKNALSSSTSLSKPVQSRLMEALLAQGWGKFPHGFSRMLKCPKRYGLKLADISILTTVYDRSIAAVHSTYFISLSAQEFKTETGMDLRDVRRVLSDLTSRGILLKISLEGINFWALNPHFFTATELGNSPLGKLPRGNAHSVKKGNLPTAIPGEITHGQSVSNDGNQNENRAAKNLFQESLKESLLSESSDDGFPEDMNTRWEKMKANGQGTKAEKEREIFKSLLKTHKETFFKKCGRVISHLEKIGITKDGKHQPIHSPMSYIENHWDINLARFEEWEADQRKREEDAARKLDYEAKALAGKAKLDEEETMAAAERKHVSDTAAGRFLELYQDVSRIEMFILEALRVADSPTASSFYAKYGWEHPLTREVVLDHFLKCECGERTTEVNPELFQNETNL